MLLIRDDEAPGSPDLQKVFSLSDPSLQQHRTLIEPVPHAGVVVDNLPKKEVIFELYATTRKSPVEHRSDRVRYRWNVGRVVAE